MATKWKICRDGKRRPFGRIKRTKAEAVVEFWKKVKQGGKDDCWPWIGRPRSEKQGYGGFWFNGKHWRTHRFAFWITRRRLPKNKLICHECDNPPCCNPEHLFAGTNKDNYEDCLKKGRAYRERGEDRYNATLTEADVREIRRRYKFRGGKNSGVSLAKEFGVWRTMIHAIVSRKRWKHVK